MNIKVKVNLSMVLHVVYTCVQISDCGNICFRHHTNTNNNNYNDGDDDENTENASLEWKFVNQCVLYDTNSSHNLLRRRYLVCLSQSLRTWSQFQIIIFLPLKMLRLRLLRLEFSPHHHDQWWTGTCSKAISSGHSIVCLTLRVVGAAKCAFSSLQWIYCSGWS